MGRFILKSHLVCVQSSNVTGSPIFIRQSHLGLGRGEPGYKAIGGIEVLIEGICIEMVEVETQRKVSVSSFLK